MPTPPSDPEVEWLDPRTLTPHPDNPRHGDIDAVRRSIAANGWWGVVVAQRSTGYMLAGHARTAAAIAEGLPSVPVYWVDVDDAKAKQILIADNRIGDIATYDLEQLARMIAEMDESDWPAVGFSDDEAKALMASLDADFASWADEVGPTRGDDMWPVIRLRVPPEVMARWNHVQAEHGEPVEAFTWLLDNAS